MFRALSSRRSSRGGGYERLLANNNDESSLPIDHVSQITLKRAKTVPAGRPNPFLYSTKKVETVKKSKERKECIHPLFSLFDGRRRKKKTTAKPEFTRYLEYVREGGMWDLNSNMPVIYFK
ncbi:uncharacterized protein [Euphorbia lathyris]|uniref:uncharacterized protein n=1 Tax=Euphorbia lathyris TaxID=212925 RepID=UPI003313854C